VLDSDSEGEYRQKETIISAELVEEKDDKAKNIFKSPAYVYVEMGEIIEPPQRKIINAFSPFVVAPKAKVVTRTGMRRKTLGGFKQTPNDPNGPCLVRIRCA
jgi:hypothetical protein